MSTQNNYRFGELETRALFALEESEAGLVTSEQLAKLLDVSSGRANKLAWQLARKRRLIRIKKGAYLFAPMKSGIRGEWGEEAMALLSGMMGETPYCVSYWSALNLHGLTEQIPFAVQVKSTKRLRAFSSFGAKFQFVKVKRIGEWQIEKIAGKDVKIATVEQAIADCLSHPEYCGGIAEACKAIWEARKTIDYAKLQEIAKISSDAAFRRLGYLIEALKLRRMKASRLSGFRWLDSSASKKAIGKSGKWGLLLNLDEKDLTSWMGS
jgi:predicted transcriptional regulator of viral defense system